MVEMVLRLAKCAAEIGSIFVLGPSKMTSYWTGLSQKRSVKSKI